MLRIPLSWLFIPHIKREVESACERVECASIGVLYMQAHHWRLFSVAFMNDNTTGRVGLYGLSFEPAGVFGV